MFTRLEPLSHFSAIVKAVLFEKIHCQPVKIQNESVILQARRRDRVQGTKKGLRVLSKPSDEQRLSQPVDQFAERGLL